MFYKHAIGECLSRRLALEGDLRHAQSRDELRVYYQPQIDSHTAEWWAWRPWSDGNNRAWGS